MPTLTLGTTTGGTLLIALQSEIIEMIDQARFATTLQRLIMDT